MQLTKSNEELNSFIYTISHDLKTPLVSLQGFSSLLIDDYKDKLSGDGKKYLERIQKNSEQIGILLDDLLELSRIGRLKGKDELVDISEVISDIAERISSQIEKRGTRLIVNSPMPALWGERIRFRQIFANLIINASKFIGEDNPEPIIELGHEKKNGLHTFYVKDNGIGIDEKYHERIFQIFKRLNDVKTDGTGVGLSIVKKVVEDYSGKIWVDSTLGQ